MQVNESDEGPVVKEPERVKVVKLFALDDCIQDTRGWRYAFGQRIINMLNGDHRYTEENVSGRADISFGTFVALMEDGSMTCWGKSDK